MGTLDSLLLLVLGLSEAMGSPSEVATRRQERGMWENLYKSSRRLDSERAQTEAQQPFVLTDFGGFWSKMGSSQQNNNRALAVNPTSPWIAGSGRAFSDSNNGGRAGAVSSEKFALRPANNQNGGSKTTRGLSKPSGDRETTAEFLNRLKEGKESLEMRFFRMTDVPVSFS
jgi:hypothetical protein